jgi:hypothetical protein
MVYVDYPSGHLPEDLVDLEGSMGHDGDSGRSLPAFTGMVGLRIIL